MSVHATRFTTHLSERSSAASHKQDDRKAYPLKTTKYPQENNESVARTLDQCRADALRAVDRESFSWSYHFKLHMIAGVGFLDVYDISVINLASAFATRRKRMYGMELAIIITTASVLAYSGTGHEGTIIGVLVIWWFVVRFASTSTGSRSWSMPMLFTPQGWENLADSLAALVNGFPRDARESRNGRKTRAERRREQTRARAGRRPGSLQ